MKMAVKEVTLKMQQEVPTESQTRVQTKPYARAQKKGLEKTVQCKMREGKPQTSRMHSRGGADKTVQDSR